MAQFQPLPAIWLLSDRRNDAVLEKALQLLPRGSGFVYRHYHLPPQERLARFRHLARLCRRFDHRLVLADSALTAREWGAEGIYGAARALYPRRHDLFTIATAHDLQEIGLANRIGADAVTLSPVFPTRSHRGAGHLGVVRFRLMAARAQMPVIALGGMDSRKADRLHWHLWAAIDGLS